ncbi:MAG TPA: hypothetical protein VEK09_00970 [Jatrophihabitantaceae bacterium]|nr:hypothetical protein [Jatrophihabitantaceae bacterium]
MQDGLVVVTYVIYLLLGVALTMWVGRTLSRNGRVFLEDVFCGDRRMAEAVNHLLVAGFYLINFGFVVWYLRPSTNVHDARQVFDALSVKVGVVLLVLGGIHLGNLWLFTHLRRNRVRQEAPPLPTDYPYRDVGAHR